MKKIIEIYKIVLLIFFSQVIISCNLFLLKESSKYSAEKIITSIPVPSSNIGCSSLAIDSKKNIFLAAPQDGGIVYKFDGSVWKQIGQKGFGLNIKVSNDPNDLSISIGDISIRIDSNDKPYIAFDACAKWASRAITMEYDGEKWVRFGESSMTAARYSRFVINNNNVLYLSSIDNEYGLVDIFEYKDNLWNRIPFPVSGGRIGEGYQMVANNDLFLTYLFAKDMQWWLNCSRYQNGKWENLGNPILLPAWLNGFDLRITAQNAPYISFGYLSEHYLYYYNNSDFSLVNTSQYNDMNAVFIFDDRHNIFLALGYTYTRDKTFLNILENNKWQNIANFDGYDSTVGLVSRANRFAFFSQGHEGNFVLIIFDIFKADG